MFPDKNYSQILHLCLTIASTILLHCFVLYLTSHRYWLLIAETQVQFGVQYYSFLVSMNILPFPSFLLHSSSNTSASCFVSSLSVHLGCPLTLWFAGLVKYNKFSLWSSGSGTSILYFSATQLLCLIMFECFKLRYI